MSQFRVSSILPALNEAKDLRITVRRYIEALELAPKITEFEVILVNDGSTDGTGALMDQIAKEDPRIRVLHFKRNRGLGNSYKSAIHLCRFEYVHLGYGYVPHTSETLSKMFQEVGNVDIVLGWPLEIKELKRGVFRHLISRLFLSSLNSLFGISLHYLNGQAIYPKAALDQVQIYSQRSGAHAEITIKLITQGLSYKEVGFQVIQPWERAGVSRSVNFKNFWAVTKLVGHLVWEIKFLRPFRSLTRIRT